MRRALLCVALTVAALAATGGIATAAVDNVDFGDHTNTSFDGRFEVVNDNNEPANNGDRIVFSVTFSCTADESIAIIYTVNQPDEDPKAGDVTGDGFTVEDCTGTSQEVLVVAETNDGEPTFSDEDPVDVEGIGTTDTETGLNDIDFASDDLQPFSPENP